MTPTGASDRSHQVFDRSSWSCVWWRVWPGESLWSGRSSPLAFCLAALRPVRSMSRSGIGRERDLGVDEFVESVLHVGAVAFGVVEFGSEAVVAFADPVGADLLALEFLLGSS